ncbi:MAG TPA: hypothetical protein VHF25_06250 [Nitriliruptorales bacterium]|nr:hypothetical protein [Nitriliruptorales bacterium]
MSRSRGHGRTGRPHDGAAVQVSPPAPTSPQVGRRSRALARVWNAVVAGWGAFTGLLPHLLHHVGPIAGTALVAGAGGREIFAAVGLLASVPFLVGLHRRFRTWLAPGVALAIFAVTFSLSTFVIGPWISGTPTVSGPSQVPPAATCPSPHDQHGH